MFLLIEDSKNPLYNLALEEYIFKNFQDDFIRIWQNNPSVIIGKHQNTLKEVNIPFVKRNNIEVIRRLSGGGTVYHDEGNLNFSFFLTRNTEMVVDFRRYMAPVFEAIRQLVPEIEYSERNDLFLHGKKFSGNAEHAVRKRVLHHGTLLFNTDLENLVQAITPLDLNIEDKAVASVRSKVVNLCDYIQPRIDILQFKQHLEGYILSSSNKIEKYELNGEDRRRIEELVDEKYSTWEWNYGYSPKYSFTFSLQELDCTIELKVKKGIIYELLISNLNSEIALQEFKSVILNQQHRKEVMDKNINKLVELNKLPKVVADEILNKII